MTQKKQSNVVDRFLRYVKIDTESIPGMDIVPSSEKQKTLSVLLAEELTRMGADNVRTDSHGYVYAEIPSNLKEETLPVLGFIAHMDTSPAVSGKDVKPRVIECYDGKDIVLSSENGYTIKTDEFPSLSSYIGQDLIVTDGNTLLGADDKAGVAEIMTMAEILLSSPEISHGEIRIAFTPDEEVGNGTAFFDVEGFGADFAYTVDGGALGEIEYENFNAAQAKVHVYGKSIHPGAAKGQMKNALLLAMEFHQMLPAFENPAFTEGYEGFYHLDMLSGSVDSAEMEYIIRDHDMTLFTQKKERFEKIVAYLNEKYGKGSFEIELQDSYYNMKEKIEPHMYLISNAQAAMRSCGIEPITIPIRGGTDGARLSYMGLPCPNLCTGGLNFHGRYEYISIQSMEKVVELLIKLAALYGTKEAQK